MSGLGWGHGTLYSEVQCIMGSGQIGPSSAVDRMTDWWTYTTENITFPQLHLGAVNNFSENISKSFGPQYEAKFRYGWTRLSCVLATFVSTTSHMVDTKSSVVPFRSMEQESVPMECVPPAFVAPDGYGPKGYGSRGYGPKGGVWSQERGYGPKGRTVLGGMVPGGGHSPRQQIDRHLWKHYLTPNFVGGR